MKLAADDASEGVADLVGLHKLDTPECCLFAVADRYHEQPSQHRCLKLQLTDGKLAAQGHTAGLAAADPITGADDAEPHHIGELGALATATVSVHA
jgi:hypothetical protein